MLRHLRPYYCICICIGYFATVPNWTYAKLGTQTQGRILGGGFGGPGPPGVTKGAPKRKKKGKGKKERGEKKRKKEQKEEKKGIRKKKREKKREQERKKERKKES